MLNWNLGNLSNSLKWFSGTNPQQPVPHQQIIAGYYDSGDGVGSAQQETAAASGVPGLLGLMYTTWGDDYSQLENFAATVYANWPNYLKSIAATNPILINPNPPGGGIFGGPLPVAPLLPVNATGSSTPAAIDHAAATPANTLPVRCPVIKQ
jgi:hypothetical protein